MEKLWTTAEVAQFLGIEEVDVEQLVRQGQLTGYKLGGQFLRFRPDQVESLKGKVAFRPQRRVGASRRRDSRWNQLRDFIYFYDFYLMAAGLLAVLIIYLIAAG